MATFATIADFKSIAGNDFYREYTSDLNAPEAEAEIENCLQEATDLILTYMLHRYTEEELATSDWVKRRCARVAIYYLSTRRAQSPPQHVQAQFITTIEDLERVSNSNKLLIPGITPRHQPAPTVNNYEVDDFRIVDRLRRRDRDSTSSHPGVRPSRDDYFADYP